MDSSIAEELQDRLLGCLIGLARAADGNPEVPPSVDLAMLEGLAALFPAGQDSQSLEALIQQVTEAKRTLAPDCFTCASPCGRTSDYDMKTLWDSGRDSASLKTILLYSIRCMAVYAYPAAQKGVTDSEINSFFYKALFAVGMDCWGTDKLLPILTEAGEVSLKCRELFRQSALGTPSH